ncbi:DUF6056 family protein [Streptomyces sp. NPDC006482]|uniref:DUF6056 family protein n=1 Tax=Streptomyces sp. NPDC006482 TaxID=3154306 RepID=UPI0033BC06AB
MNRTTTPERGEHGEVGEGGETGEPDSGQGTDANSGPEPGLGRALSWIGLAVAAGSAALLAVGAFLGLYVRPTSDDWCALWKSRDMGALGISSDFYLTQNGRVTNAFVTGILYSHDMRGPKLLPAFLVVALGVGLFLLARAALRALRLPRPPVVLLAAAAALLSALLFFAGTRPYQALLWAPATISHTLPSLIGLWAVLGAVRAARSERRWARTATIGATLLIGTAVGMLSEPFTLVAGVFAAATGLLCLPRFGWAKDRYVSTWCATACVGLGVGLVLLYTSPGARWRRAQHPAEPLSLAEVGETFHDWWRVWQAVGGQWAYAGAFAVGGLLGLGLAYARTRSGTRTRSGGSDTRPLAPRRVPRVAVFLPLPLVALASLAVTYGLRSGYGVTGWTYARTWTSFLLPFLLALCAYGTGLGLLLGRRLAARGAGSDPHTASGPRAPLAARVAAVTVAGTVAVACTAALVPSVRTLTTTTVVRSLAWDRQDARIRSEIAAGAREVTYRPLPIGYLAEPFFTPAYTRDWVAQCVSRYYGADRIGRP